MNNAPAVNIFWFRRDLRLEDNTGLSKALQAGLPVLLIFIFDRNILDRLGNKIDDRVEFIYKSILAMQKKLTGLETTIEVYYGKPVDVFSSLFEIHRILTVFANEDYEPYARERDEMVEAWLKYHGSEFRSCKDHVIFSKQEVLKEDGSPYTVFTPYSNKWKSLLNTRDSFFLEEYPSEKLLDNLFKRKINQMPGSADMGFVFSGRIFPPPVPETDLIRQYAEHRDFPGQDKTSHLGVHLRFGTISIRRLAAEALKKSPVFLNELIWRDFYQMILWHFPGLGKGNAFKKAYENIPWRNNETEFVLWCEGKTGYPMVDAGMRQLNETGFMHNRLRMITASFLSKHLLIDWRWGEAYFAEKLLDFDLASNNGGWQWAAGCGCDAAPYFRIFNPSLQQKKFDPEDSFIKRWVPEYKEPDYPLPIVEHVFARERAIQVYQKALNG